MFYRTVQYLQNNRAWTYTNAKLYPHNLNVLVDGETFLSSLVNQLLRVLTATQRFLFFFLFFWCHLDLFDTTYYAAITIGKCNHVVQSGGSVKRLYSSIILFKF